MSHWRRRSGPSQVGSGGARNEAPRMMTDVVGGARTYAIKGYRPLMFGVLAVNTLMFGTVAVLLIGRNIGLALAVPIVYAVMVSIALRAQRRTAVRLTVSEAGLDVAWIFGQYRRSWEEIRRIRLLHSRFSPTRIQQIEVVFANRGPLELFDRLCDVNELVAELRETRPQLVED